MRDVSLSKRMPGGQVERNRETGVNGMPVVWGVGALCRAIADALDGRFNPVQVRGEITGFSRAASGHCYFSVRDDAGQIRCAMFRRAASGLDFVPRDGAQVELVGRLGLYEARGDLQLIVESMRPVGAGNLFEQFLLLKSRLEAQGLFAASRKRLLPERPRGIAVITSPGAAAWHDVMTALQRRAPHVPVVLVPSLVQGALAPAGLVAAMAVLEQAALRAPTVPAALSSVLSADAVATAPPAPRPSVMLGGVVIDVVLVVRGGGALEDLWAFNDESVARALARCPVPVISGVGHETDFTIADFVADVRAPTPTAAAELAVRPLADEQLHWARLAQRLVRGVNDRLDKAAQRLDRVSDRLGRPSGHVARAHLQLQRLQARRSSALALRLGHMNHRLEQVAAHLPQALSRDLLARSERLGQAERHLALLDPGLVLQRGYSWLTDARGTPVVSVAQLRVGLCVSAVLADGRADLTVDAVQRQ
jgi:exodeoxyribonuclease VII large subunit